LKADGTDRWSKEYHFDDYMQSLENFIGNDKRVIDQIIRANISKIKSEDSTNSIGFINEVNFEKWLSKINQYRNEKIDQYLPFSLTDFSVENFPPIKKTTFGRIPKNVPFIFLVGDNGSGKSSILKALAISLGNKYFEEDIATDSQWLINVSANIGGRNHRIRIKSFDPQTELLARIPFAGYGPSRLIINNRNIRKSTNEMGKDRTAPLWSLFYPDAILLDINRWIINHLANTKSKQEKMKARIRFENIKLMLISIIPHIFDIREISWEDNQELLYFEEDFAGNR
jgi:hypothetical protein